MADGHLNKCKSCAKKDAINHYNTKMQNEVFVEKERLRSKEKKKRLGHNHKIDLPKPNDISIYKNIRRKFNVEKGYEIHHWNYFLLEDVFILKIREHKKAHKFIKREKGEYLFKDEFGNLLDTKQKHYEYLISKGVIF